ncbi:hypothetical protein L1887_38727 [Cichorium endivia]|nr:hypothetical protein L1887_38727 [Cichorium endivia]
MFLMLSNMVKREHFDAPISHHVNHAGSTQSFDDTNDSEKSLAVDSDGPWKEETAGPKPCWSKPEILIHSGKQFQGYGGLKGFDSMSTPEKRTRLIERL